MGQGFLLIDVHLSESPTIYLEDRVVPKTTETPRLLGDRAFEHALGRDLDTIGKGECDDGEEPGRAIVRTIQYLDQLDDIVLISGPYPGEPGGMDTWGSVESGDFQPGVIGQGGETGGADDSSRLQQSILLESVADLVNIRPGEPAHDLLGETSLIQDFLDLGDFVGILRRDDEPRNQPSTALRCMS